MKGTMKRGLTAQDDLRQAQSLRNSPKNQAENVMIVDMVRNDMGRIAEKGQVNVEQLFHIMRLPTVWQMTSTVSARTQASLGDIFKALFPCASITGAPKPRTMSIIAREENSPRKIYTGTLGYLAPHRQAQFNVAIRTVLIDTQNKQAEYGVGGGITWDSTSGDEYEECWTKAKILSEPQREFQLLETLLWTPDHGCFLLERHLARLGGTADYFGFECPLETVRSRLIALNLTHPSRIRLMVTRQGQITIQATPFDSYAATESVRIRLAQQPVDQEDPFLYHKTTWRQAYENAKNGVTGCDDVLLWNTHNELTESTIANIVVDLDGDLCTPPVASGLLAGTFRAELLAQGTIRETVIRIPDLSRVRKIFLINSLRKWREATLA
jgi:para-aminobenzoate synthetase/4-amino-4-deoxychorismate lyase